jgi:hypothetical protein
MGVCTIPYKIYTKKELFGTLLEKRQNRKDKLFIIFFEYGRLSFGLIYEPRFSCHGYAHFDFYAMSKGLEQITETGYLSEFAHHCSIGSYQEIKNYWIDHCKRQGLDLIDPEPYQGSLF